MKEILVDEEGYKQYLDEIERLKQKGLEKAVDGSDAYKSATGDGWHDNFEFEQAAREQRDLTSKLMKMIKEKVYLKVIKPYNKKDVVDIGSYVKLQITYSKDDIEILTLKLTGKYIPENDEITLNSPIGKAIYLKNKNKEINYELNNNKIKINILEIR